AKSNAFFPTLGNHDWTPNDYPQPYLNYFKLPGNERYYDFVRGPVHFFNIDSDPREPDGVSPTSKQGQWLKGKLAASPSPFDIVYFHHAPFGSGDEGSSAWMPWSFESWGADLVLPGHNHIYEGFDKSGFPF